MDHVLKKYCLRIEFDSTRTSPENSPSRFLRPSTGFDVVDRVGRRGVRQAGACVDQRRGEERVHRSTTYLSKPRPPTPLGELGIGKSDVVMRPAPPLGVLGVRRGPLQAGRHHHPPSLQLTQGRGLPRQ